MRNICFLLTLCILAFGVAYGADVTVDFPSATTYYCSASNGCGYMTGGTSAPMWTTGDFITETFVTGQSMVTDLSVNFGIYDDYSGNPGATYEDDVFVNGIFVGSFLLPDCTTGCGGTPAFADVTGTVNFAAIFGAGTYNISIVLADTAPAHGGSQWFSTTTVESLASTATLSTPEPGSLMLLGSGVFGMLGFLRRKLL